MKVALIQLPHVWKGNCRPPTEYPLGLGYLASVLSNDYHIVPVDLWQDPIPPSKAANLSSINACDVICISVYSTQYLYFRAFVRALRANFQNDKLIIAGGPGATHGYEVILRNNDVDVCVIGEGEHTLIDLLRWEFSYLSRDIEEISGIAYTEGGRSGKMRFNHPREQIKDLDSLPLPDRDLFDVRKYIDNSKRAEGLLKGYRSTNLIAGRGCPYSCSFCSRGFEGARLRKPSKIAEEVGYLKDLYRLNAVEFNDELVITSKKRVLELCDALRPLDINWGCQGRINIVDREILTAMKRAGCIYVGYGVESYTQNILDAMHKGIRVDQVLPAIRATREVGIKPVIQYMFGFPGEDDESLRDTIEFFSTVDEPYIGMVTTPMPGSRLYEDCVKDGKIKDEEKYLLNLSAGYNSPEPLVKLTEWDRDEFCEKHEIMAKIVNDRYYSGHPWKLAIKSISRVSNALARRLR